jgi:hypothetical protein
VPVRMPYPEPYVEAAGSQQPSQSAR